MATKTWPWHPAIVLRSHRPLLRSLGAKPLRKLCRYLLVDALLVVAVPLAFTILTRS